MYKIALLLREEIKLERKFLAMITHFYKQEQNCIETLFTGKVTKTEIIDFIHLLIRNNDYPKDLKILINASQGRLFLKPSNLFPILEENIKMFTIYNTLKVGIVIERPIDTALAVLYTRLIQLDRYQFHVFNTETAARQWIYKEPKELFPIKKNKPIHSKAI